MFQETPEDQRPLVLTGTASVAAHPTAAASLAEVATFVEAGDPELDFGRAFARLAQDHATRVLLVEGGPSINGQLIAADLVDELCLTISPVLTGGSPLGVASGPTSELRPLRLVRVVEENGFLLLRYLRAR
jgi:riboflavin biosynthesis pyrimidine reductase